MRPRGHDRGTLVAEVGNNGDQFAGLSHAAPTWAAFFKARGRCGVRMSKVPYYSWWCTYLGARTMSLTDQHRPHFRSFAGLSQCKWIANWHIEASWKADDGGFGFVPFVNAVSPTYTFVRGEHAFLARGPQR